MIARVASERLTPEARAAIRDLLHPDDTLPDVADWADHEGHEVYPGAPPGTTSTSRSARPTTPTAATPAARDNVVHQIAHYRSILADRSKPKTDRQRALLFLVHFVEDVHQPLHVGENRRPRREPNAGPLRRVAARTSTSSGIPA